MATDNKSEDDKSRETESIQSVFYAGVTTQLEDIHSTLKKICDTCIQFHETEREFISEETLLLEESLSNERKTQEVEHEELREALRQKTEKEQRQSQERILRKTRSLIVEQNKNSQVWD